MAVRSRRLKRGARWRFQRVIKGQELRSLYIYPTKQAAEMAEAKAVAEYLRSGRMPSDPPEIQVVLGRIRQYFGIHSDQIVHPVRPPRGGRPAP